MAMNEGSWWKEIRAYLTKEPFLPSKARAKLLLKMLRLCLQHLMTPCKKLQGCPEALTFKAHLKTSTERRGGLGWGQAAAAGAPARAGPRAAFSSRNPM